MPEAVDTDQGGAQTPLSLPYADQNFRTFASLQGVIVNADEQAAVENLVDSTVAVVTPGPAGQRNEVGDESRPLRPQPSENPLTPALQWIRNPQNALLCCLCLFLPLVFFWVAFVIYTLVTTWDMPPCPADDALDQMVGYGDAPRNKMWNYTYMGIFLPFLFGLLDPGDSAWYLKLPYVALRIGLSVLLVGWGVNTWNNIDPSCIQLYESDKYWWLFFLFKYVVVMNIIGLVVICIGLCVAFGILGFVFGSRWINGASDAGPSNPLMRPHVL